MRISCKNRRKMNMTSRLGLNLSRITDFGKWEFSHHFNQTLAMMASQQTTTSHKMAVPHA
jgi:hypothetical protein